MASVSYGLNRNVVDKSPDQITIGTLAITTNDVELRWDNTKGLTRREIIQTMEAFIRRLEDGRFNDPVNI